jgi:hypothetical protein
MMGRVALFHFSLKWLSSNNQQQQLQPAYDTPLKHNTEWRQKQHGYKAASAGAAFGTFLIFDSLAPVLHIYHTPYRQ